MKAFLYGRSGAGKSSVIKGVLKELDLAPSGFLTVFGPQERLSRSLHIISAAGSDALTDANRVARCFTGGSWESFGSVFDSVGVGLLTFSARPQIVVMDEIGFMEAGALLFQQRVLDILDGDLDVLGAIKSAPDEFMQKIYCYPAVRLFEVTEESRNGVFRNITEMYKSSGKTKEQVKRIC